MQISEIFKALGDPVRLNIVKMLAKNGELCVCHIVEGLNMGQPVVSHHLAKLKNVGLVTAKKRGQWVDYSLNADVLDETVLSFVRELVDKSKSEKPAVAKLFVEESAYAK